jgi:trans-aconitate methyltransferase
MSGTPFPYSAFRYLATAENKHWWFRARNCVIIWMLGSRLSGVKSFLKVGCGTDFVISGIAKAFPSLELEASEYFEEGLFFPRQRLPQCRFRQLDATAMAEQNAYDCIGSFDVIEHIDADDRVLSNFN